jgi:hypothetical protein
MASIAGYRLGGCPGIAGRNERRGLKNIHLEKNLGLSQKWYLSKVVKSL